MGDFDYLFRDDGTPIGIGYLAGIKGQRGWARPPSIRIDLGDKESYRLCRTINVCRRASFDEAWEEAIGHMMDYYRVTGNNPLFERIKATLPLYLKRYGIKLKTIRVIDSGG